MSCFVNIVIKCMIGGGITTVVNNLILILSALFNVFPTDLGNLNLILKYKNNL